MKLSYHSSTALAKGWPSVLAAVLALLFGVLPLVLASAAALGAPAAVRPSPILTGPAPGPCAGATTGAEYIGGTDAYGHRVVPAETGQIAQVHLESETVLAGVRTGRHGPDALVDVEVAGLGAALDAPTACSRRR